MLFRRLFARVRELLGTWRIWLHGPAVVLDVQERIHQCRSIVDFSFARDDTNSGSDLYHRLALRAKANRHLVDAMGINNSLTTADPDIHRAFLKKAATQLRKMAAPWHWQRLYASAAAMLEEEVSGSQVLLAPLVRSLCLRVVMQVLFGPPSDVLDTTDVVTVCSEINRQWMLSKQDGERGTQMQQSAALNEAMARLLLQHGEQADLLPQAALELILPAYEALWRVVLLTFVTACHRTREGAPQFLLQTVNMASVLGTGSAEEKQVLQIAKEGLRLFPSSKRIYRARSLSADDDTILSADVFGLHRDVAIWGPDALVFRSERFDAVTPLQKEAYLPFGSAPHLCPAYHGFGERMILLLVAMLSSSRLGTNTASIVFNDARLDGDRDAELPTGRNDMEAWELNVRE